MISAGLGTSSHYEYSEYIAATNVCGDFDGLVQSSNFVVDNHGSSDG